MKNLDYKNLIEDMPICYARHKLILDIEGNPTDYEYIEINRAFESTLGIKREDIIGKKITEVLPKIKNDSFNWIEFYGEVALSGVSKEMDQYSEQLGSWYKVKVVCPRAGEFITYFMDVSEEKSEINQKIDIIMASSDIVFELDESYRVKDVVVKDERSLFISREEMMGQKLEELLLGEELKEKLRNALERAKQSQKTESLVYESIMNDGKWYASSIKYLVHKDNPKYILSIHDVTEKRLLEMRLNSEKELLETMLHSIGDAIISVDCEGRVRLMNPVAENLTGWRLGECEGEKLSDVMMLYRIDNEDEELKLEACTKGINKGLKEGLIKSRDGKNYLVDYRISNLHSSSEEGIQGSIIVFRDITAQKKKHSEVLYLSYHDQLTGLYNRRHFEEELKRLNSPSNLPLSIINLDVNGLKLVNDAFGHKMGDALICSVSDALRRACRSDDVIARIGGDEFTIILPSTSRKSAEHIISRIYDEIEQEELESVVVSASVGCGTKDSSEESLAKAIKQAEEAMYRKKIIESKHMRESTLQKIKYKLFSEYSFAEEHSRNVSRYMRLLGRYLGFTDKKLTELDLLGELHDIGLVVVDAEIPNKKRSLNRKEWKDIKRHSETGYQILKSVSHVSRISEYVLSHHERIDGNGYPNKLRGSEIPLESRMLAIVDAYDAMTNSRSYRQVFSKEEAVEELKRNAGTQFDEEILKVFLEILEKEW